MSHCNLITVRKGRGRDVFPRICSELRLALGLVNLGDVRELGEVLLKVLVPLGLDGALVRALAVAAVDGVDHLHAPHDLAKGGEAHAVEVEVVLEVDEHLRGAAVLAARGKGDGAPLVALGHRVVLDLVVAPLSGGLRLAGDAPLDHEVGDDAEEAGTIPDALLHNFGKPSHAKGRPLLIHLQVEGLGLALAEVDLEGVHLALGGEGTAEGQEGAEEEDGTHGCACVWNLLH
mmetsp:Transcript_5938/g.20220  ORF Transcript_5938/g.20220 Transcript_5938/m.20220 type:complete len:232 (-) Transcript_5938:52-747(-)